ncbi:serpin family protein [Nitratiruptor tergarcus]|uniref:Serine protease inhibitor n=1 Tax=Nitratiruptor tergarcus DSM 16512 TaxID=1069081 RepID=A0A1W1WS67_9BACT|nr:serpin family protein [Nitratiruptor tergarcus]SMC09042.1 Serine protease inhibitor [Nitratiruptor tergarcus DSM 16512]
MRHLWLLFVLVFSLFAEFHPLSLQYRSFNLSGKFKYFAFYPETSQNSAYNWVYETPRGNCYRLHGVTPSRTNVFGWKKINLSCDTPPVWLFYYIGDLDNDGDTRFDFIAISADTKNKRVYRLLPVEPGDFFRYEDLGFFNYTLLPNSISFSQGFIKYLGLKRNHEYRNLPKFQVFTHYQEAKDAGFDYPIDFTSYKLLLYKIVQTSGSNRIIFKDPQFFGGVIKIPVKIIRPEIGTADMAYYIAAFAVSKDTQKVVFDYGNREDVALLQQITSCDDEPQAPVCGLKQIECITTPCEPLQQTYPNYCVLKADSQARFLHSGSCENIKETNRTKLATSIYQFGMHLTQKLYDGQNLFISPFSIVGVLDMLYFGAHDESRTQIRKALDYPSNLAIGDSYEELQKQLQVRDATLAVANAAWVEQKFHLYKSYRYLIEDLFDASIYSANFLEKSEEVRQEINSWVEEKTHEKIKDLLPQGSVQQDTRMVLVNALYFYGKWQKEFNKTKTEKEPFYVASQESIQVDMMNMEGDFNVSEMDGFRALELPYKNAELSMWLFLPNEDFNIQGLLENLSKTSMQQINSTKREMFDVLFKMPKFKLTWGTKNIVEELQALGIVDIFDPVRADLSLLGKPINPNANLFVSGIFHKTFIEVTEEGSEAAAATATTIVETSAQIPPVYTFYCDKPFVFMIVHNKTLTPLFMGVVSRP